MDQKYSLKFVRKYAPYNVNEVAGFSKARHDELVGAGVGVSLGKSKPSPANKMVEPEVAKQKAAKPKAAKPKAAKPKKASKK